MEFRFYIALCETGAFGPITMETSDGDSIEMQSVVLHGPFRVVVAQEREKEALLISVLVPTSNGEYKMQGMACIKTYMEDAAYFEMDVEEVGQEEDGSKLLILHIAVPGVFSEA